MQLPKKGEVVSLKEIETICVYYGMTDLLDKIQNDPPEKPFKSDGCSAGWPDTWNGYNLYPACFKHDLKYWAGYPGEDVGRLLADAELLIDVANITQDVSVATIMFGGVRAGGGSYLKQSFSWGFGRL